MHGQKNIKVDATVVNNSSMLSVNQMLLFQQKHLTLFT